MAVVIEAEFSLPSRPSWWVGECMGGWGATENSDRGG